MDNRERALESKLVARERLVKDIVDGVWNCREIDTEGHCWLDNLKAVAKVHVLLQRGEARAAIGGEPQPVTDANPDIREIAFDFVGDLGLPEHRTKEWLSARTERLVKRIVAVVNKYRGAERVLEAPPLEPRSEEELFALVRAIRVTSFESKAVKLIKAAMAAREGEPPMDRCLVCSQIEPESKHDDFVGEPHKRLCSKCDGASFEKVLVIRA